MLRTFGTISRRLESLRQPGHILRAAAVHQDDSADAIALSVSPQVSSNEAGATFASAAHQLPSALTPTQTPTPSTIGSLPHEPSTSACTSEARCAPLHTCSSGATPTPGTWQQPLAWVSHGIAGHSAHLIDSRGPAFVSHATHQQTRSASSKGVGKGGAGAKGGANKAKAGAGGASASGDAAGQAHVRTPEWARMPVHLEDVVAFMGKRKKLLSNLHGVLSAELTRLEGQGWTAAKKRAEVAAAVEALPIALADQGAAQLATATAPDTPFEAALDTMKKLVRTGVVLGAEPHLAPLLRKASSPEHLTAALELLRRNHLAQAAMRLGAHEQRHGPLHEVLVKECERLRTAAPLVELWESLYEHGMEASAAAAAAAVRAAAAVGDGGAAAALLGLTCQYTPEPLAGGEVPGVLKLLDAGSAEQAANLRKVLPQLGLRVA